MPIENLIQRADLNQRLTRALEIKGQKSPVLQLENSVVAVVIAEDLTRQAEWLTPTERKLASSVTIGPVAGQTGILAISNPVGSGVIGLVHRVTAVSVTSQLFKFGVVNPAAVPANPANLFFRDRRNTGSPTLRAFSGTDAVLQIVNEYLTWQVNNVNAAYWLETPDIVIAPGETWGIQGTTANIQVVPTIWCEEIPIA